MSKPGKPVSFRPSPEVAKWLKVANDAGFNPAQVINLILSPQIGTQVEFMIEKQIRKMNDAIKNAGSQGV